VTFVNDVTTAMSRAKEAAGEKDVLVHGAGTRSSHSPQGCSTSTHMHYAVFLLSRIKEARDSGHTDLYAVAIGLERTGRIVTAAALLFTVAIGAFATSQIIFIKQVGVGTALAVLIDATIVRALLVPSLTALLGRWNWWAPAPLRPLHARLRLSEA
jgi:uncharacterized membrane protein YdfJ with MMPL/SSD domain